MGHPGVGYLEVGYPGGRVSSGWGILRGRYIMFVFGEV